MALDRLNSPTTFEMPLEVLGHELQFTQERNCRKGRFSPAKLKGKRVIELGAGYGVSGFGNTENPSENPSVITDEKSVCKFVAFRKWRENLQRENPSVTGKNPSND
ncbi:hypothetical protein Ahy_A04g020784 isoform I [Arachis hypogaea]|uniref:Uncharacterized protein n=1 Tax=Arachis hypogaea TaxID=3818 RepID=A0A445DIT8_ARAHY|nr:hypothetical protein Ahy_A04g020784 isoform I [Arachis hypogaea]